MWPLISPASGACSSFILRLDQRVARLPHHRLGARPRASAAGRSSEHFTSKMTARARDRSGGPRRGRRAPAAGRRRARGRSRPPRRSGRASPSKAMPSSAPVRRTSACRSTRFAGTVGSGWWLGKVPSDSQKSGKTSAPSARRVATAMRLPDPVAAVHDDPHRPRQLVPGDDRVLVPREHRAVRRLPPLAGRRLLQR